MNQKSQAFTDLFLFIIIAFVIILFSAIFIYMGIEVKSQLETDLVGNEIGDNVNYSVIIDDTIGQLNTAYSSLYWISLFLIIGMVLSIFIGNYMITTKPVFFVAYIFVVIIAIVISVGIAIAYQQIIQDPTLASIFANFIGSNYLMLYLPVWVTIIGFTGGIIMFARMRSQEVVQTPFG